VNRIATNPGSDISVKEHKLPTGFSVAGDMVLSMSDVVESRTLLAKYYDEAYAADEELADAPFYLDLARQTGGPVLELGCGTGRVLLAIARAGIAIDGVDNSLPMLHRLRRKLELAPAHERERVRVFEGDMRNFRCQRKYPLIIIPFRPLQHMYTVEDQLAALRTAAFHLQDGGLLAFDVYYPKFDKLYSGFGQEVLEMEWRDPADPRKLVRRYYRKDSHDKIHQNIGLTFIFRSWDGNKLIQEEREALQMSYYTYPHLRALFMLAGLQVKEEYGSFSKAPLDNNAEEMIFVLRKAG
jgi:SAM-dependent methyltransferase